MSVDMLSPPGDAINEYKHGLRSSEQAETIPQLFRDAMTVREEVFIDEQKCSLENEVDEDDARSWHWVIYVSVANSNNGSSALAPALERKDSANATATRKPVGTIRLVPPPHPPHPAEGDFKPTPAHHEPYLKITRLAISKDYRKKYGLSRQLLAQALTYAVEHPALIYRPPSPASLEKLRLAEHAHSLEGGWNGLVLVHAQVQAKGYWERLDFIEDPGLGKWDEEGIDHVGMWRRLPLKEKE